MSSPTQQADALARQCAQEQHKILYPHEHDGSAWQESWVNEQSKIISTTCHLPELLALEEAVRKDHSGKNVRAHCKICHALAALAEAKRKEEV